MACSRIRNRSIQLGLGLDKQHSISKFGIVSTFSEWQGVVCPALLSYGLRLKVQGAAFTGVARAGGTERGAERSPLFVRPQAASASAGTLLA